MKLTNNILVAVDFRESSENIIHSATEVAKKIGSKITLIHILPKDIENEKVGSLVRKAAEEELEKISNHLKNKGVELSNSFLKFGTYSEQIIATSEAIEASLIILGSGEKLKKDTFQLGTTAGKVIRKSGKPVLIIKKGQELNDIKNIICPVDFSEESSNALNNAIEVSRLFNAKLIVLSAYNVFNQTITKIDPAEVNRQRKLEQEIELKRFLRGRNLEGVDYVLEIPGGNPAEEILKAIEKYNADLLLMGTTGKTGLSKILLGSVAERVTKEVLCSFITFKQQDFLIFETKTDLEKHYTKAAKLFKEGLFDEAIQMYQTCLKLNFVHIPSLQGLVKTYTKLGDTINANKYQEMINTIFEQVENFKKDSE